MREIHQPVLLNESVEFLITDKSGNYFDGTLGFGGHSRKILEKLNNDSTLIATDVDEYAFKFCKELFNGNNRIKIYNYNFSMIDIISKIENIKNYNGIFADLGVSSYQLDSEEAGFSFRIDTPLDFRMDKTNPLTASEILNNYEEKEIADIIYQFGEEKKSRRIAKKIVEVRKNKKFESTQDLVKVIEQVIPEPYTKKTLARVFQSLRIFINDEMNNLKTFLKKSINLLSKGGRIVVISYHSLEDRIVKEFFKYEASDCICPVDYPVCKCEKESSIKIITKKPIIPSAEEIKNNFRARSAKLRAAEKL